MEFVSRPCWPQTVGNRLKARGCEAQCDTAAHAGSSAPRPSSHGPHEKPRSAGLLNHCARAVPAVAVPHGALCRQGSEGQAHPGGLSWSTQVVEVEQGVKELKETVKDLREIMNEGFSRMEELKESLPKN